jgi:endonuclease/exonuclease/phosphatase family metal-dependent hydrolase
VSHFFFFAPEPSSKTLGVNVNLTVLDQNVWHGLYARSIWRIEHLEPHDRREGRFAALVASVRELKPDILAVQECFPQPSFGRRLAQALGYEHVSRVSNAGIRILGYGFPPGGKTGEGSSILARPGLGLRSLGGKSLSGFGWTHGVLSLQPVPKRCALAAEVTVEGKRLRIVTAHLRYEFASEAEFLEAWARLRQAEAVTGDPSPKLMASIRRSIELRDQELEALRHWCHHLAKEAPLIVAADVNLDDDVPALRAFSSSLGLTSALPAVGNTRLTWDPATNPNVAASTPYVHADGTKKSIDSLILAEHDRMPQRPDHVLLGPTFRRSDLLDARVVLDQPRDGVVPSDHYGILATVRLV